MKKWMIGVLIGVGAAALGVGAAFACNAVLPVDQTTTNAASDQTDFLGPQRGSGMYQQFGNGQQQQQNGPQGQNQNGQFPGQQQNQGGPQQGYGQQFGQVPGQQQGSNQGGMPGMNGMGMEMLDGGFGRQGSDDSTTANTGTRITLDVAYANAQEYISSLGSNLEITRIYEFENEDYVLVSESDTGRGAVELSVDPYTGNVTRDMMPANMWNLKYGMGGRMMGNQTETDSTLTLEEALTKAQDSLKSKDSNAVLDENGISFYGYYTFVYTVDGQTSGMLSVNGISGNVSYHDWLGTFVSEKEY